MRILGVVLSTPTAADLAPVGVVGLVTVGIAVALMSQGVLSVDGGVTLSVGAIAGALSNAYGASVARNGWRGAVICWGFGIALMVLVQGLLWL